MKSVLLIFLFFYCFSSCNNSVKIDNISNAPKPQKIDESFADVYKILDGKWKGNFLILEDPNPVSKTGMDLQNLTLEVVQRPELKLLNELQVEQNYTSETPYFQRVNILDFYPKTGKKEKSEGVNKIQNGQMWCVVRKPNETIIHKGSLRNEQTIIWQSQQKKPQKIEFFQETVSGDFYEIIGYGYYDGDDLGMSPRLWFYGKYEKQ